MSIVFFSSLSATLAVSALTVKRFALAPEGAEVSHGGGHASADPHAKAENGKHEDPHGGGHGGGHGGNHDKQQLTMLDLGTFAVELKAVAGRPGRKPVDLADIAIVLECGDPGTYSYIEQRLVQARSQLTNVFLTLDREELLTREGKAKLKARILDQINAWLPKGQVQNVFFSKLIIG